MLYFRRTRKSLSRRILSVFIAAAFSLSLITPPSVHAQAIVPVLNLPPLGAMVNLTPGFTPVIVRGLTFFPEEPFRFNFIVDSGDTGLKGDDLEGESSKLIKYFLASLTVPEDDMWVNLSPYENDRIVPKNFGDTEMGRDLLAQDYILKQLTASLMYPEEDIGKTFWDRVYSKAFERFGSTDIPLNTFNKIWIVPDTASVLEHENNVYVVESHLKVMLEEDYVALNKNLGVEKYGLDSVVQDDAQIISGVTSDVVRQVLIPEIEKEVNEGKTFANLRQIYNSMILATWYKESLKQSLLGQIYVDKSKTKGVDNEDKQVNQKIYDQYVAAFKKGVYDYIKEDYDPATRQIIPRKYFSGGFWGAGITKKFTKYAKTTIPAIVLAAAAFLGTVQGSTVPSNMSEVKVEVVNKEFKKEQKLLEEKLNALLRIAVLNGTNDVEFRRSALERAEKIYENIGSMQKSSRIMLKNIIKSGKETDPEILQIAGRVIQKIEKKESTPGKVETTFKKAGATLKETGKIVTGTLSKVPQAFADLFKKEMPTLEKQKQVIYGITHVDELIAIGLSNASYLNDYNGLTVKGHVLGAIRNLLFANEGKKKSDMIVLSSKQVEDIRKINDGGNPKYIDFKKEIIELNSEPSASTEVVQDAKSSPVAETLQTDAVTKSPWKKIAQIIGWEYADSNRVSFAEMEAGINKLEKEMNIEGLCYIFEHSDSIPSRDTHPRYSNPAAIRAVESIERLIQLDVYLPVYYVKMFGEWGKSSQLPPQLIDALKEVNAALESRHARIAEEIKRIEIKDTENIDRLIEMATHNNNSHDVRMAGLYKIHNLLRQDGKMTLKNSQAEDLRKAQVTSFEKDEDETVYWGEKANILGLNQNRLDLLNQEKAAGKAKVVKEDKNPGKIVTTIKRTGDELKKFFLGKRPGSLKEHFDRIDRMNSVDALLKVASSSRTYPYDTDGTQVREKALERISEIHTSGSAPLKSGQREELKKINSPTVSSIITVDDVLVREAEKAKAAEEAKKEPGKVGKALDETGDVIKGAGVTAGKTLGRAGDAVVEFAGSVSKEINRFLGEGRPGDLTQFKKTVARALRDSGDPKFEDEGNVREAVQEQIEGRVVSNKTVIEKSNFNKTPEIILAVKENYFLTGDKVQLIKDCLTVRHVRSDSPGLVSFAEGEIINIFQDHEKNKNVSEINYERAQAKSERNPKSKIYKARASTFQQEVNIEKKSWNALQENAGVVISQNEGENFITVTIKTNVIVPAGLIKIFLKNGTPAGQVEEKKPVEVKVSEVAEVDPRMSEITKVLGSLDSNEADTNKAIKTYVDTLPKENGKVEEIFENWREIKNSAIFNEIKGLDEKGNEKVRVGANAVLNELSELMKKIGSPEKSLVALKALENSLGKANSQDVTVEMFDSVESIELAAIIKRLSSGNAEVSRPAADEVLRMIERGDLVDEVAYRLISPLIDTLFFSHDPLTSELTVLALMEMQERLEGKDIERLVEGLLSKKNPEFISKTLRAVGKLPKEFQTSFNFYFDLIKERKDRDQKDVSGSLNRAEVPALVGAIANPQGAEQDRLNAAVALIGQSSKLTSQEVEQLVAALKGGNQTAYFSSAVLAELSPNLLAPYWGPLAQYVKGELEQSDPNLDTLMSVRDVLESMLAIVVSETAVAGDTVKASDVEDITNKVAKLSMVFSDQSDPSDRRWVIAAGLVALGSLMLYVMVKNYSFLAIDIKKSLDELTKSYTADGSLKEEVNRQVEDYSGSMGAPMGIDDILKEVDSRRAAGSDRGIKESPMTIVKTGKDIVKMLNNEQERARALDILLGKEGPYEIMFGLDEEVGKEEEKEEVIEKLIRLALSGQNKDREHDILDAIYKIDVELALNFLTEEKRNAAGRVIEAAIVDQSGTRENAERIYNELSRMKNVGGISLNRELLNMKVQRDTKGHVLPLNLQPQEIREIDGLYHFILDITPITTPLIPLSALPDGGTDATQSLSYQGNLSVFEGKKRFEIKELLV
ncbi:MAG TPA: hypothetical protein DD723_09660 [Candidatus Omnitrophica bacterium]|nr:MAG: hypothetical protein A2Z81_03715 [Omnitrophica WOR_2 bacterium GWA2_45_18]HBR15784.1 hypothetical protein [Candidatus Omnitrophota bacterium]